MYFLLVGSTPTYSAMKLFPSTIRELNQYVGYNIFFKGDGGYYKRQNGVMLYVVRALYLLSFDEWLEIAKNESFISNTK